MLPFVLTKARVWVSRKKCRPPGNAVVKSTASDEPSSFGERHLDPKPAVPPKPLSSAACANAGRDWPKDTAAASRDAIAKVRTARMGISFVALRQEHRMVEA